MGTELLTQVVYHTVVRIIEKRKVHIVHGILIDALFFGQRYHFFLEIRN